MLLLELGYSAVTFHSKNGVGDQGPILPLSRNPETWP